MIPAFYRSFTSLVYMKKYHLQKVDFFAVTEYAAISHSSW